VAVEAVAGVKNTKGSKIQIKGEKIQSSRIKKAVGKTTWTRINTNGINRRKRGERRVED
jgi:hypothetical protein